ncbi:MAG: aminopeptidase P N-terminal domain-containing protein [Blastocatellia bacterium]|nr:aminopeptidase P N-terminal domain-containing protein [Blastocatellia bacterium]
MPFPPFARRIRPFACVVCALVLFHTLSLLSAGLIGNAAERNGSLQLGNQPLNEYKARRQKLMNQTKDGVVALIGDLEESNGIDRKFRQNDNFLYLTGVDTPGSYLLLVPEGYQTAREILFLPARDPQQERWTGPQIGPSEETAKLLGFDKVLATTEFSRVLNEVTNSEFRSKGKPLYTVDYGQAGSRTREREFTDNLRKSATGLKLMDVRPLLAEMRKVKSASEIALLQKAVDISNEGQMDVLRNIAPGKYEYEMEALVLAAFYRNGAERPGYPCIVGSGIYSTVLHYNKNKKQIEDGDTVVVDVGAEFSQYTADLTRTFPANGKFTPRQREIYQLVLDAQEAAAKGFKPGESTMADLNYIARDFIHNSPLRSGELTMDTFFIHGLGHFIGMNVHDVGDYSQPLPVGAVFTIEPGIYIPSEKIGVRIEDNYLVTEKGLEKLSKNLPSRPEEIERLMAEARRGKKF